MALVEVFAARDRQLSSWIAGFIEHTDPIQSPELHRKWAAIGAIAGALERKVWLRSQNEDIYPNLYIFLVGPPGTGKTRALMSAWNLWRSLEEHKVAEISLTKAALIDALAAATRIVRHPNYIEFNSLLVASPELSALIPSYDSDFMAALTHLYDCFVYSEKRRSQKDGPLVIERPQINLIACTTPGFLLDAMPPGAWNQGFLSRVIIIYNDISEIRPFDLLEEGAKKNESLERALKLDIKKIGERVGRMAWTRDGAKLAEEINEKELEPKPEHPRLIHYSTRRPVQFLKLCMIAAADRGAENIDVHDCQTAYNWMIEAEGLMPEVFKAMQSGGDAQIIHECWHLVMSHEARHGGEGMPDHQVYMFLQNRASSHTVHKIFELMLSSKMLTMHAVIGGGHVVRAKPKS